MILIRADANEIIGTGHMMRCLSIANACADYGEKVLFVTADSNGNDLVKQKGFDSICMGTDWAEMDGELDMIKEIIQENQPSLFIIDSYNTTNQYCKAISKLLRTVYVDDLNESTWDVDYIVNYNLYSFTMDYSRYKQTRTKLLLGPQYAPLRSEFKNLPKHTIKSEVTDILISSGGADPEAVTERMIINICPKWKNIDFHFVVGALNPRLEQIKHLTRSFANVKLHINESKMSGLMRSCDLAISAAGSTLYELCACGIPTITYTLANNQITATKQFEKQKIMLSAGDCRNNNHFLVQVERGLQQLVQNMTQRKELSVKMQTLVDGNGAQRIVEELLRK